MWPKQRFVREQGLENFLDGKALPRGTNLGMMLQIALAGDAQNVCKRPLSRTNTSGGFTCRLPRFSNQGGELPDHEDSGQEGPR